MYKVSGSIWSVTHFISLCSGFLLWSSSDLSWEQELMGGICKTLLRWAWKEMVCTTHSDLSIRADCVHTIHPSFQFCWLLDPRCIPALSLSSRLRDQSFLSALRKPQRTLRKQTFTKRAYSHRQYLFKDDYPVCHWMRVMQYTVSRSTDLPFNHKWDVWSASGCL